MLENYLDPKIVLPFLRSAVNVLEKIHELCLVQVLTLYNLRGRR